MNAKVFLLLPCRSQKMSPYKFIILLLKSRIPQNESGYCHNACKTLSVKKSETIFISLFFLISSECIFCCLFSLIYKLINPLHYLFHIHAILKALIDFLNPFLIPVVFQHFFHCMF
ncbi:hypothetical protein PT2222_120341 [Paraburkholderia tropica]